MPGIYRYSVEGAVAECRELAGLGIKAVLLFGIPISRMRSPPRTTPPRASSNARSAPSSATFPECNDRRLCNCEYTDHGHCGILDERGDVDNDATLELLARTAFSYAEAGVDVDRTLRHDGRPRRLSARQRSTPRATAPFRSCRTRSSSLRHFTDRFATQPIRRRSSAIGARIKWIRPTPARPYAKRCSISTRVRIS